MRHRNASPPISNEMISSSSDIMHVAIMEKYRLLLSNYRDNTVYISLLILILMLVLIIQYIFDMNLYHCYIMIGIGCIYNFGKILYIISKIDKLDNIYNTKAIVCDNLRKISHDLINIDSCAICLSSLCSNNDIYALKCTHQYHLMCIISWLKTNDTCPICKLKLKPRYCY